MVKDILTVLGIDGFVGVVVYAIDPFFLKWVLLGGLISLLALFFFTRHGKVSVYGTQLVMAIIMSIHFA